MNMNMQCYAQTRTRSSTANGLRTGSQGTLAEEAMLKSNAYVRSLIQPGTPTTTPAAKPANHNPSIPLPN